MKDNEQKGHFYFHGKWFDNFDDMFKYSKEWMSFPLDEEAAESIFNILKKDIIFNVFLRGKEFTNSEFAEYIEEIFLFSMKKLEENDER